MSIPYDDDDRLTEAELAAKIRRTPRALRQRRQNGTSAPYTKEGKTRDDLHAIELDRDDPDVNLAIRDALHPSSRQPDEHFRGLKPEQLKRLLESRLGALKRPKLKAIIDRLTKQETALDRKHNLK